MATRSFFMLSISSSFSHSISNRKTSNSKLSPSFSSLTNPESSVSLLGKLVPLSSNWKPLVRKRCSTKIFVSLPTAKPEKTSTDKVPKWSAAAVKSFAMSELEARKLKYPTTGTEALLMGILIEGTSSAAKFLRANGITLFKVREETVNLLGKSDMYFFSPEHPPLTEPAQRALDWAIDEKLKSGEPGEVTPTHLLLGIWSEESAGHKIMAAFGFNDEKAKELAMSVNKNVVMNPN